MRLRLWTFVIALSSLLALPQQGAAQLQGREVFTVGWWKGYAYTDSGSGRFSHCAAVGSYQDGTLLVFTQTSEGFRFSFANPRWKMQQGQRHELVIAVDGTFARRVTGTVQGADDMIQVDLRTDTQAVAAIQKGTVLSISGGQLSLRYMLNGSARAIAGVHTCFEQHAFARQGPSQRYDPFASSAPGLQPRQANYRIPKPTITLDSMRKILTASFGDGVRVHWADKLAGAYEFAVGNVAGLYWEEDTSSRTADDVISATIRGFQNNCPKGFGSGTSGSPGTSTVTTRRGFVVCNESAATYYTEFFVMDAGTSAGIWMFTGLDAAREEVRQYGDGLLNVVDELTRPR